jgi:CBS-domain-containing membrane protein
MELTARDIMATEFETLHPEATVQAAVRRLMRSKARDTGYKPFGIMVVDEVGRLVGMVSMYDIIYHLRPTFMNYEVETVAVWGEELEAHLNQFKDLKVRQVMSSQVITVAPEDHFMVVIDRMVKKKCRRMPVVEHDEILGIVYLSDVVHHLCDTWLNELCY